MAILDLFLRKGCLKKMNEFHLPKIFYLFQVINNSIRFYTHINGQSISPRKMEICIKKYNLVKYSKIYRFLTICNVLYIYYIDAHLCLTPTSFNSPTHAKQKQRENIKHLYNN